MCSRQDVQRLSSGRNSTTTSEDSSDVYGSTFRPEIDALRKLLRALVTEGDQRRLHPVVIDLAVDEKIYLAAPVDVTSLKEDTLSLR